jgi:hypothetical protein
MQGGPLSCWQCGTVVSASGGRCPACGAEQPPAEERQDTGRSYSRGPLTHTGGGGARSSGALPWIVGAVALAALGGAVLFLRGRDAAAPAVEPEPPLPAATASAAEGAPGDLGPYDPRAVDPAEIFGKAKTRALAWSKDAVLVSIRARPVVLGRVDVGSGGSIEYFFGKPSGEGLGAGAKVASKRLMILLGNTGTKVEETSGGAGRAALEPNCPLDAAAHAAQAAGLPANTPLTAIYEQSERLAKPVWRVSTEGKDGAERQIDGMSCAVLVR